MWWEDLAKLPHFDAECPNSMVQSLEGAPLHCISPWWIVVAEAYEKERNYNNRKVERGEMWGSNLGFYKNSLS